MTASALRRNAVARLRGIYESREHDATLRAMIDARAEVLAAYQPFFRLGEVEKLTREEFRDFLMFRNNRHWTGLQRMGPATTGDMPALRRALAELLDESVPIAKRLDSLLPNGRARVKKLGKAILTPILMVAYPERYAVWNGTSEGAMRELEIWPEFERGASVGRQYERLNGILPELAEDVGVDLWTLDGLWWRVVREPGEPAPTEEEDESEPDKPVEEARFGLERHLHEFLVDNWERTSLANEWELRQSGGDVAGYGSEVRTPIGRIDLLARHRSGGKWMVIELKRDQTSDATVGQVMRYMGWVQSEMAEAGEEVHGLIIGSSDDDRLRYALKVGFSIRFMRYEVDFRLLEDQS